MICELFLLLVCFYCESKSQTVYESYSMCNSINKQTNNFQFQPLFYFRNTSASKCSIHTVTSSVQFHTVRFVLTPQSFCNIRYVTYDYLDRLSSN